MRINSFLQRPRALDRPLIVKLQKSTYRAYKSIWKQLLCFVYRTAQPAQPIRLSYQLTSRQVCCLDEAIRNADRLLQSSQEQSVIELSEAERETDKATVLRREVDVSCLNLCIALLDHDLKGDLFESAVVGFLAVLSIDPSKGILREAYHFTPFLSGLIKIAQMLVVEKAVRVAETSVTAQPADFLDEMRERFLMHGTRSPFSWATRLRAYGKKVRDSTTCHGYISWTDDSQQVTYREVRDLSMDSFRGFVRTQLSQTQAQLEKLLLLHPDGRREDLDVRFHIHHLVDNAAQNRRGWNFLQDQGNLSGPLPDRQSWLLDRVLQNDWLREEFMHSGKSGQAMWRQDYVRAYKAKVDLFLEHVLLLMHLTSGQHARGTELLSLRYVNTLHGHHRNIFIDSGMVSTVTSYHKGYSITNSTNIIHCFLPKEVGELLVYYLWLVLPFCQNFELLAFRNRAISSFFLWAKPGTEDCWEGARLGRVIKREFQAALGLKIEVAAYRHLENAISRKHLPCKGFKRDYGFEDSKSDN